MKTAKIHGLKLGNPARNTQKLKNSQTKTALYTGCSQPVMPGKIEPAVFDVKYIKNVWNKLVKFFKEQ